MLKSSRLRETPAPAPRAGPQHRVTTRPGFPAPGSTASSPAAGSFAPPWRSTRQWLG